MHREKRMGPKIRPLRTPKEMFEREDDDELPFVTENFILEC